MAEPEGAAAETVPPENTDQEEPERGLWASKVEFFLSSLGFAIGFGNVWRFPYLVYKNGGGVFLIPYCICLAFIGLPLFFLEFAIGQYSGYGPTLTYRNMAPIMSGLGYCMLACSFLVCLYYNVLLGYVIFYMFDGMRAVLPWAACQKDRYDLCIDPDVIAYYNGTENVPCMASESCKTAAEDYFFYRVVGQDGLTAYGWTNYGPIQGKVVVCLMAAWGLVYLALIKGIQSSGKVVYFTALFPFFVLCILFINGLTLDGSGDGISYYLSPTWSKLGEAEVWADAATQIFFSLGTGFGGLITLSSYNKFNNDCHRDAVLVALLNCGTSFFAGFVIFSILGFMAQVTGQKVEDVVTQSVLLAFVTIPAAISHMPAAPFWSFMFFFMMITLGLDSMFALMETLMTALFDHLPHLRPRKPIIVAVCCFIGFLLGISMCAPNGLGMLTLLDNAASGWTLLLVAFAEVSTVSYIYGFNTLWNNIDEMGMKMQDWQKYYWISCWVVAAPVLMFAIVIWKFYEIGSTPDENPAGIQALGWMAGFFTLIALPIFAIYKIMERKKMGEAPFDKALLHHTSLWPKPGRVEEAAAAEAAEEKVQAPEAAADA